MKNCFINILQRHFFQTCWWHLKKLIYNLSWKMKERSWTHLTVLSDSCGWFRALRLAPSHNACPSCRCPSGVLPFKPLLLLLSAGRKREQEEEQGVKTGLLEGSIQSQLVWLWGKSKGSRGGRGRRKSCRLKEKKKLSQYGQNVGATGPVKRWDRCH